MGAMGTKNTNACKRKGESSGGVAEEIMKRLRPGDTLYRLNRTSGKISYHVVTQVDLEAEAVELDRDEICYSFQLGTSLFLTLKNAQAERKEMWARQKGE